MDEAVRACVSSDMNHILELLLSQTENAMVLQGLRYGSRNTRRNLKWILVGWDQKSATWLSGALPGPCASLCERDQGARAVWNSGAACELSAGAYLDNPFYYPTPPQQIVEAKALRGSLETVDESKLSWGFVIGLQARPCCPGCSLAAHALQRSLSARRWIFVAVSSWARQQVAPPVNTVGIESFPRRPHRQQAPLGPSARLLLLPGLQLPGVRRGWMVRAGD
jgi:hypothetical protein